MAGLVAIVQAACADAGLVHRDEGPIGAPRLGLPRQRRPAVEQEALEDADRRRAAGATSSEVFNDTFAVLRAGLDEPRGVAVVCGAGINCSGLLPDGTTVRFAAVGHISGDWGGGGHLWQEAMWWAARAEDGRGPDTRAPDGAPPPLRPRHHGRADRGGAPRRDHRGAVPGADPGAVRGRRGRRRHGRERIVRRQAEEVVALALAAMRRLDVLDEPIDVVLGGGVLTAGHALLMDEIDRLLRDQAPLATTTVVRDTTGRRRRPARPRPDRRAGAARERLRDAFRLPAVDLAP